MLCCHAKPSATRALACRHGKSCRPVVGLGLRHEACEAAVVHEPCRGGASGAPGAGGGVGRERRRHGPVVPGVCAVCPLLLLSASMLSTLSSFFSPSSSLAEDSSSLLMSSALLSSASRDRAALVAVVRHGRQHVQL